MAAISHWELEPGPKEKRPVWMAGFHTSGLTLKKIPSSTRTLVVLLVTDQINPLADISKHAAFNH